MKSLLNRWLAIALILTLAACSRRSGADLAATEEHMWRRVGVELADAAAQQKDVTRVLLIRQEIKSDFALGPGQDLMEASCRSELAKRISSSLVVDTVALPAVPPPDPKSPELFRGYRTVEAAFLDGALKRGGSYSLVISLLGPPAGAPPAGTRWPPIICYTWENGGSLAARIRDGAIVAAVAPRHDTPPKREKDWFALRYTVVTPANVDAWQPPGDSSKAR